MNLSIKIDNVYEDGEEVTNTLYDLNVEEPPAGRTAADVDSEEWADWAYDNLFPHTGTGKTQGDAGYFVEVIACDDPTMVGTKFEWGI
jgi:hypothetical protein